MSEPIDTRWSIGNLLISLVALFTAISPYLADWNETHIYNPQWPPHAKFHNAQTMVLGALLGLLSLYCLWFRRAVSDRQKLDEGTVLASLYWLAQLPAAFFPSVALSDPGGVKMPVIFGVEFNQLTLNITIIFPLLIWGLLPGKKISQKSGTLKLNTQQKFCILEE